MQDKEQGTKLKDEDSIYRMTITKEAGEVLERLANDVNEGFIGSKISRQDVASWAIQKFARIMTPVDVKELRLSQMTDQALLRFCMEKTSADGEMAPDLRQLLLVQCGLMEQPKRPSDKRSKEKMDIDSERQAA